MNIQQLKKYGTNQLVKKLRADQFTDEERNNVLKILEDRKFDLLTIGLDKNPPQVKNTPQEVIDFIDKAINANNVKLCQKIGKILEGNDDYESLTKDQIDKLINLRDMVEKNSIDNKKEPKVQKEKPIIEFALTDSQKVILDDLAISKSEKMRKLFDDGLTVAQISNVLKAHYSFVFGVIKRHKENVKEETEK